MIHTKSKIMLYCLALLLIVVLSQKVSSEPVEAGFGKIKAGGLFQYWYQHEQGAQPEDNFRLRRTEIKLSGEIKPEVAWAVMIDPAAVREDDTKSEVLNETKVITSTGRKSALQDLVITFKPYANFSVDVGQYKIPFGMEGIESSAKLDFAERSALCTKFKWSDVRDIGVALRGNWETEGVKIQPVVGIFNGEKQNRLDVNDSKDFAGKLVVKPFDALHLGVSHYNGKSGTNEIDEVRTGVEIKFAIDPISIYGEYADGKGGGKNKQTYYVTAGYKFLDNWQVVARYDWYDPDTDKKDDERNETTLGVNYFIEKHNAKIQLNYIRAGEKGTKVDDDIVRLNVQVSY